MIMVFWIEASLSNSGAQTQINANIDTVSIGIGVIGGIDFQRDTSAVSFRAKNHGHAVIISAITAET